MQRLLRRRRSISIAALESNRQSAKFCTRPDFVERDTAFLVTVAVFFIPPNGKFLTTQAGGCVWASVPGGTTAVEGELTL